MTESKQKRSLDVPSQIKMYPQKDNAIDQVLKAVKERCPAELVLAVETSGVLISIVGERNVMDPVALASLVAGDMVASQEIARITGQYQRCQLILREGLATNTFIAEAGDFMILFVQVEKTIPIGWARLVINEACRQLATIIVSEPEDIKKLDIGLGEEDLGRLIDDAVNAIWTN